MGENSAPIWVRRAAAGMGIVALACLLCLIPAASARALDTGEVAQQWANVELQKNALVAQQRAGQLSPEAFRQRYQNNRAALDIIGRIVATLPPATQAEVRQQAQVIYNNHGKLGSQVSVPAVSAGAIFRYWWLLLLPVAGAAGYLVWRRRTQPAIPKGRSVPAALQAKPLPAQALQPRPLQAAASTVVPSLVPPAAVSVAAQSTASVASSGGGPAGSARGRVLAQVAAKYQASITAAMDALTETQIALQQNAEVPEAIRQELRRIGSLVYGTINQLLRKYVLSTRKALINAAMLRPLLQGLKRRLHFGSLGFKLLVLFGVFLLLGSIFPSLLLGAIDALPTPLKRLLLMLILLAKSGLLGLIVVYLLAVAAGFFFERRAQKKAAIGGLDASAAALKSPSLLYAYANQVASGAPGALAFRALRISSAKNQALMQDTPLANQTDSSGIGGFALWFDNAAAYRIAPGGTPTLMSVQPGNGLMSTYGVIVTDALMQHAAELEPLYEAVRRYGDLKWRERQQSADIPRIEALLANVAQLEKIWRPVAVADNVFDFLIRRIDLFNLRENATPNGLLLCGYTGYGKEFLARKIAESVFAQFVKPTADQLAAPQSIKDLWAAQIGRAPLVLFVDYADQVQSVGGHVGRECGEPASAGAGAPGQLQDRDQAARRRRPRADSGRCRPRKSVARQRSALARRNFRGRVRARFARHHSRGAHAVGAGCTDRSTMAGGRSRGARQCGRPEQDLGSTGVAGGDQGEAAARRPHSARGRPL